MQLGLSLQMLLDVAFGRFSLDDASDDGLPLNNSSDGLPLDEAFSLVQMVTI